MKNETGKLTLCLRDFFHKRLEYEKEASPNTIDSYAFTISKFCTFLHESGRWTSEIDDISDKNVLDFIEEYSKKLSWSNRTCNHHLAVLKSLARYVCRRFPQDADIPSMVLCIGERKVMKRLIAHFEADEMRELLKVPDRNTDNGLRHYAILLFMYNTGARVSEVSELNINQLHLHGMPYVTLMGKGKKERTIPLWEDTVKVLRGLLRDRIKLENEPVFLNKCGNRITRKGITRILESIYARAVQNHPPLREKHITPHVIRHTTAMHLLKSGVDINTIRLWLGHVSIETTHGYAEADLDMKRKALAKNEISIPAFASKRYHVTKDRLSFLENL